MAPLPSIFSYTPNTDMEAKVALIINCDNAKVHAIGFRKGSFYLFEAIARTYASYPIGSLHLLLP